MKGIAKRGVKKVARCVSGVAKVSMHFSAWTMVALFIYMSIIRRLIAGGRNGDK